MTAFLMTWPGAAGQDASPPRAQSGSREQRLQHRVSVTLKLIQVFVTDGQGRPAMGLEKSDFSLTDNGVPQTITEFEPHVLAPPRPGRTEAPAALSPQAGAPLLSRKFFILIDYVGNGFEGVQKAKKAALEFLETKVRPADEVGLFTISSTSGLTLHEYLTTDHGKIRTACRKLRDLPGGGGSGVPGDEPVGMELMNAQIFGRHGGHGGPAGRNLFTEIAQWAKALRAIPGQKNIVLFTQGFGGGVVRPGRLENMLFETMARELASANAPVFTVDTSPQVPPGSAIEAKLPSGTLTEGSLAYLSQTTGGRFLGSVNDSDRIAAGLEEATANYYVLGFYIPEAWDGRFHEIKVEIVKKGYQVHAQRGYFNPVPFAKLTALEKHIRLIEVALAEAATRMRDLEFPMTALPVTVGPASDVLLLSQIAVPSLRSAVGERTELISLVLDENKAIVDGQRAEIDWGEFDTGTVFQYAVAGLAPGRYECRTVVRNIEDGRSAVGACTVEVAGRPADGPTMFPPLLLVPGGTARYLNLAAGEQGKDIDGFHLTTAYLFPAKEYDPLVGALEPGRTTICAALRCAWGDKIRAEGDLDLAAWLTAAAGGERQPIAMSLVQRASRGQADLYLLECELPELEPGRYRLEIEAEDAKTGPIARTAADLIVRRPE